MSTPTPPLHSGPTSPLRHEVEISVVVPAYNEEHRLPSTLDSVIGYLRTRHRPFQILVVDDGSVDQTAAQVAKRSRECPELQLLTLPRNLGKGAAVREGMLRATGARVLFSDADGSTPISELPRLEAALEGGAEIAIGSRALLSAETTVAAVWYRTLLGRIFNLCVNSLLLPHYADTQCGFKLFTQSAAQTIFSRQRANRFSFDLEVLFLAERLGFKVKEVPVNWHNVPGSKVNLALDGVRMLCDLVRFRFWHRK